MKEAFRQKKFTAKRAALLGKVLGVGNCMLVGYAHAGGDEVKT